MNKSTSMLYWSTLEALLCSSSNDCHDVIQPRRDYVKSICCVAINRPQPVDIVRLMRYAQHTIVHMAETQADRVHYTCRKCGTHLFSRNQVMHEGTTGHAPDGIGVSAVKTKWAANAAATGMGGRCTSVFVEDMPEWADSVAGNEGRLNCPKCKSKVGGFAWSGAPCSCGKWVTPAFQFQLSRIDPKGIVDLPVERAKQVGPATIP